MLKHLRECKKVQKRNRKDKCKKNSNLVADGDFTIQGFGSEVSSKCSVLNK
jgi:hypothetical protein